MDLDNLYNTNKDFKDYIDRFLKNNPEYTKEQLFKHKIIIEDISVMYSNPNYFNSIYN